MCDFGRIAAPELSRLFSGIAAGEVWGGGRQLTRQLADLGIASVENLRTANPKLLRERFPVALERTADEPHKDAPQYQRDLTIPLPEATDDTLRLTRAALWGLKRIYRTGFAYQKAGVTLLELTDRTQAQLNLFAASRDNARLMQTMDRINAIWGRGTLRSAAEGIRKTWQMKRERMSPGYTTDWRQVPVAY